VFTVLRTAPAGYQRITKNDGVRGVTYVGNKEASMPDKSPKKPSAKKTPDRSLKEKRQDKKDKKAAHTAFGRA
jgi:hypothetical protein